MPTTERPSVLNVLHSSTLLNALTPEQIDELAAVSRVQHVDRGEIIWLSGDQVDFFGLAASGFVKMVRGNADGSEVTVELMGPGQIFGLMGTITGSGCPLSAMAVTDLWYLRIPKRAFLPIYQKSEILKDKLVRRAAIRLHGAVDLLGRMASGRVEERIAAILFILAESYGEMVNGHIRLQVPLTRQEIGEMAGTTVESTIRTMSRWQKEGIVSTEKHLVTILNDKALDQILAR